MKREKVRVFKSGFSLLRGTLNFTFCFNWHVVEGGSVTRRRRRTSLMVILIDGWWGRDEKVVKARGAERKERQEGNAVCSFDFYVKETEDLTFKKGQERQTQTERETEKQNLLTCYQLGRWGRDARSFIFANQLLRSTDRYVLVLVSLSIWWGLSLQNPSAGSTSVLPPQVCFTSDYNEHKWR